MKIIFSDIPPEGIQITLKDTGWSSDSGVEFKQSPWADITLLLTDKVTAVLEGNLKATINIPCSRCGNMTLQTVDEKFSYTFRLGEEQSHDLEELECSNEDIETLYLEKPEVNIDEVLREQLILSIPDKTLCSRKCKGICPGCGAQLNDERCSCDEDFTDSPFAALKKLKK